MSEKRKPTLLGLASSSVEEVAWEASRLPDSLVKMLSFKDGVTFFLAKMAPGGEQPAQRDEYRQIRYVLEGRFVVNGQPYGPGTMIDIPENTDYTVSAPSSGEWFVLEMPGKSAETQPTDPRLSPAA